MDKKTVSIFFKTKKYIDNEIWGDWYYDAKKIINLFGYESTHLDILSDNFKFSKIRIFFKNDNKIKKEIEDNNQIDTISIISLPKDYKTATFDYNVLLFMNRDFVIFSVNKKDFYNVNEKELIDILNKYGEKGTGEVFEMDREDFPFGYAAKFNSGEFYKTLKIIKKI